MQGCLTKLRILFHCLLDGGQFNLSRSPGSVPTSENLSERTAAKKQMEETHER